MLTHTEIQTFLAINKIGHKGELRWGPEKSYADWRYGVHGVYDDAPFIRAMTYALRMPEYDIFTKGEGWSPMSWSSRSGYCMFNLTPEAEERIRQRVYEYNAEQMIKTDE
jgi:hypothetical protein